MDFRKITQLNFFSHIALFASLVILFDGLLAQSDTPALGQRYAMLIVGPGGEEAFTQKYFEQASRLYDLLESRFDYTPNRITYLFEDPKFDSLRIDGVSDAQTIRSHMRHMSDIMKPQDQLFVCLIGHGSFDGDWAKFNLVGPDLKDIEYAQLFAMLPSQRIVFINTASASGPFIKRISEKQRIVVTATKSGAQHFETNFADFFIDALASDQSDFDKDNRISIKEAFQYARTSQDQWFEENRRLRAEHPLIDDNGDGEGSQTFEKQKDGLWASRVYLGPARADLGEAIERVESGTSSPRDRLLVKKSSLEQQVEDLKARKQQLSAPEYARQLEKMLIELARTNKQLKELAAPDTK